MAQSFRAYSGRTAATVAITFALYLCALATYVILGASHRLHDMIGDVRVSIEKSDSTSLDNFSIERQLKNINGVGNVKLIDSKKAKNEFEKFLNHSISNNIENEIFPDIFIVTLSSDAVTENGMGKMREILENQVWAKSIHFEESIPEKVANNISQIEKFSSYVAAIIGLCALVIAYIVTRLSVGATFNSYPKEARRMLRKESYRWAWIQGAMSGIGAAALLAFTIKMVQGVVHPMVLSWKIVPQIAAGAVVVAVAISLLYTALAIRMHKNINNR